MCARRGGRARDCANEEQQTDFTLRASTRHCNQPTLEGNGPAMPFTNAEKQRRYRQRHLGVDGKKVRIQLFLTSIARAGLTRLGCHHSRTVMRLSQGAVCQG
jgi:hypothetical protein